jgi:hypothetical protein
MLRLEHIFYDGSSRGHTEGDFFSTVPQSAKARWYFYPFNPSFSEIEEREEGEREKGERKLFMI